jgi:predicted RNase H-like nuclease (RuvC/YqgF family)
MATTKKSASLPKIDKKLDSMDNLLSDLDTVIDQIAVNKRQTVERKTDIEKLREKISELNGKNEAWNQMDKTIGDLKALRRHVRKETSGRTMTINQILNSPETAPYTEIFLSVLIKKMRKIRNGLVSK